MPLRLLQQLSKLEQASIGRIMNINHEYLVWTWGKGQRACPVFSASEDFRLLNVYDTLSHKLFDDGSMPSFEWQACGPMTEGNTLAREIKSRWQPPKRLSTVFLTNVIVEWFTRTYGEKGKVLATGMSGVLPVGNLTSVLGHSVVVEKQGADTRNKVAPMGKWWSQQANVHEGLVIKHWPWLPPGTLALIPSIKEALFMF